MNEETIYLGKPAAALSYFTFIGLIIAYFMNNESKNPFAAFHIRQSLGLILGYFLIMLPLGFFDSWMISGPFIFAFFALWLFGLISAFQGKMTPVPLIGSLIQKVFTSFK
ncbi:MAG: hypothetical protein ABNH00_08860 [Dokdonia sp.]|jgi:uncharacterized membrane protein